MNDILLCERGDRLRACNVRCLRLRFSLPGGMTYNAAFDDISYLYRPDRAFRRAVAGGGAYLRAWLIGASAILLSTLGIAACGIGFFYTSVWAWSVVGYAFSRSLVLADPDLRSAGHSP